MHKGWNSEGTDGMLFQNVWVGGPWSKKFRGGPLFCDFYLCINKFCEKMSEWALLWTPLPLPYPSPLRPPPRASMVERLLPRCCSFLFPWESFRFHFSDSDNWTIKVLTNMKAGMGYSHRCTPWGGGARRRGKHQKSVCLSIISTTLKTPLC